MGGSHKRPHERRTLEFIGGHPRTDYRASDRFPRNGHQTVGIR